MQCVWHPMRLHNCHSKMVILGISLYRNTQHGAGFVLVIAKYAKHGAGFMLALVKHGQHEASFRNMIMKLKNITVSV